MANIKVIVLPVRPQPDTLVAIFLLKRFGKEKFPGVEDAALEIWQTMPVGKSAEVLEEEGHILIDIGGGKFDHHNQKGKTTASQLVADYLGISEDASIAKLLEYAYRDDIFGKGTVSEDSIDRAFGLSAIIYTLNKNLPKNPQKVMDIILPILISHHNEELKRTKELPEEFNKKMEDGTVRTLEVKQRGKKLKVIFIDSESPSMSGYLRSQNGGKFDVVAQRSQTGHVNILTRQAKHIDLRSLAVVLRLEEISARGRNLEFSAADLSRTGRVKEVPEWYYDRATNTIQNGGVNPKEVEPTAIFWEKMPQLLTVGLSEEIWSPIESK
ncbi:MAG: hypothetical protein UV75_C0001G0101 [Candidatus Giovannonibacteria bacterium GW2011_GWA1_43_15]|uniref:Uncharacterized protein n=2 Tax=Candidatus Giovannoniibacteriota TaxID=1752738 RepID=A0A0G1L4X8_9BACT|nr:MAG: hypothetical protein UV72_C0002G0146 [Candidatus Giovannonibacteria bacterium GW2011_GWB1_43_13]KKS99936.1 MAG: hypothetical protein UV75_C0001G0101 [Candidatus Giovannonibacteria bacterium GW2011_GWA1_43_15]KKT63637.1 MAG: hypothetical protein UW55_C0002G0102 [Candidatus Giovannonibacteria bacterium GW2011_GWA2_44_26]OGF70060.1 MAG: hypothetical protein A3C76_02660 [Candidatus Giovannonibacteria bacterium RIFCSPHIGHO2_02_FULL_44_51]OGF72073.1 MAG: hypothetical protein A3E35_03765 [Cand